MRFIKYRFFIEVTQFNTYDCLHLVGSLVASGNHFQVLSKKDNADIFYLLDESLEKAYSFISDDIECDVDPEEVIKCYYYEHPQNK